jgi:cysteinyl-tRNA synthetase
MAKRPELFVHNTLTREKERFEPLDAALVRMYVCGPTVYDYAHIGNARPIIVFDTLFRLLRHLFGPGHVKYVRNITDVDDKINARAAQEGVPIEEVTARTIRQFHEDIAALGVLEPTVEPRATQHIAEMQEIIARLMEAGCAYAAEGHVLYDVTARRDYGALSNRSLDEMMAGARIEVAPYKKNPMDFVLWKPSKEGEPAWDSPWGAGRPGWHIECSAMSWKHLGETFDIHGGGIDLQFPHHENEIAQSTCAFHTPFMAKYWMHNGFLQVEGQKMSKSLGNFITIHDLLADWPGEALRLNMLRTHYRQPIDWTKKGLEESWKTLRGWYGRCDMDDGGEARLAPAVLEALSDDLNTPRALAALHQLEGDELAASLRALGFAGNIANPKAAEVDAEEIEALIAARNAARADKNWAEADRIRDELSARGIVLKDGPEGTTWEVKG